MPQSYFLSLLGEKPESEKPAAEPGAPQSRRCRSVTVRGLQCRGFAQRGSDYCFQHLKYRFPVCPKGPNAAIPLLEDLDTIQVVATQVAQGLFANTLDPSRAGKILYACQIATLTMPRPARYKPLDKAPAAQEPATQVFPAIDGSFVGPNLPWSADQSCFNPIWSFHKFLYERECELQGKSKPAGPDDYPPGGWLTPDEARIWDRRPEELWDTFGERLLQLRIEAERKGQLPPLSERDRCVYVNENICDGPNHDRPCTFCAREREESLRFSQSKESMAEAGSATPSEDVPLGDLNAAADPRGCPTSARLWQMWARTIRPLQPSLDELLDPLLLDSNPTATCSEERPLISQSETHSLLSSPTTPKRPITSATYKPAAPGGYVRHSPPRFPPAPSLLTGIQPSPSPSPESNPPEEIP